MSKVKQANTPISIADIEKHLYIVDKKDTLAPYIPNRVQRDLANKLTGRDLILKYRQGGISTFFVARNFKKAITQRARIGTMAHDDETTQKLRRMAFTFWQNLPDELRPARGLDNAKTTSYKNTGSEITIATAGNTKTGRGGTYGGGFHGSEVAFWKDAATTMAGVLQGVPYDAPIALESTPNGAQGYFFERCMEALRGEGVWRLHFYQWWWEDSYRLPLYEGESLIYSEDEQMLIAEHGLDAEQIKWRRYKLTELGDLFYQEYPEDVITCFRTSGGGVFVLRSENLDKTCLEVTESYGVKQYKILSEYSPDYYFVAGLDWGQDNDYTALSIMRVKTGERVQEVYLQRWHKQSWASMRREIIEALDRFKVEKLIPERNSIGSVNIEDLSKELDEKCLEVAIQPFYTSNSSKDNIVKNMQNGLSEYGLVLLDIDYATNELRTFITEQTAQGLYTYKAAKEGHDDTVMARMLAYYAASQLWI